MAASEGNQNARKPSAGVQVNFYLSVQEKEDIQKKLLESDREPTDDQSKNGVRLALRGKCDIPECYQAASIECRIGHCAPLKRYCAYHYEQVHLPEDERMEEEEKVFYKFALKSSMSDRANLDIQAEQDGREDAETLYPEYISDQAELKVKAEREAKNWKWQAEDAIERGDTAFTDDEEEFIARYVDGYVTGYNKAIEQLQKDNLQVSGLTDGH